MATANTGALWLMLVLKMMDPHATATPDPHAQAAAAADRNRATLTQNQPVASTAAKPALVSHPQAHKLKPKPVVVLAGANPKLTEFPVAKPD